MAILGVFLSYPNFHWAQMVRRCEVPGGVPTRPEKGELLPARDARTCCVATRLFYGCFYMFHLSGDNSRDHTDPGAASLHGLRCRFWRLLVYLVTPGCREATLFL